MCGLTGYINTKGFDSTESRRIIHSMTSCLSHRGPDSQGTWVDEQQGLVFGHARLSVIDLSESGNQPMHSRSGRYVIIYNGEIYNAVELSEELEKRGVQFRGHSDTEVMLEACAEWGVQVAVEKFIGMFAFALWDKQEQILYLVRDRLGIKPLYWGRFGGLFLFASELKSLRAHPGWRPEINRDSLHMYMQYGYIPAPESIYNNINKLLPGHILTFRPGGDVSINRYWNLARIFKTGSSNLYTGKDKEAIPELEELLDDSVTRRLVSDVPLGALFSGGIDSSLVVAMMSRSTGEKIHTYSIGFSHRDYDEAVDAKKIANHLGTDHTELYVNPDDAMSVIPELPYIYDEPFSDSSQIPTCLVSRMARQHVTVALSGDGGDEVFAGYNRYVQGKRIRYINRHTPALLQQLFRKSIKCLSPDSWSLLNRIFPRRIRIPQFGDKLYKISDIIGLDDSSLYKTLVTHWSDSINPVLDSQGRDHPQLEQGFSSAVPDMISRMQLTDALTYLPDDILTKVDRASMAVSLETRVPLLDHRLVEFASRLPPSMKIRHGKGKWLLRQVLYKNVPEHLVDRPKTGFKVPIGDWLRGPLRPWAEGLLDESKMHQQGYLDPVPIRQKWQEHLSGKNNWEHHIWDILMFQAWFDRWN